MSPSKKRYLNIIQNNYIPLYFRDVYLDAVTPDGDWDVIINGENLWVYFLKDKLGITYIINPQLTPYTGFWTLKDSFNKEDIDSTKNMLPKHNALIQKLHPRFNIINEKKYTYILENRPHENVYMDYRSSTRRTIKNSRKDLRVIENIDFTVFMEILGKCFSTQERKNPYPMELLERIEENLAQINHRKILATINNNEEITAVAYIVYDEQMAYNLVNGNLYRDNGTGLLLDEAISWAMKTGRSFDFEGSMIPGVEAFFRGYRGQKTFYPYLYETSSVIIDKLLKFKNPEIEL